MRINKQTTYIENEFVPTEQDRKSLMDWFSEYDRFTKKNEIEAMADTALFPITVITNESNGNCVTQEWDRKQFIQAMSAAIDDTQEDNEIKMENKRQPIFLNQDLAVVITDSKVTIGDTVQLMRYADIMVKSAGKWKFKSMIQAGWGNMLKSFSS